MRTTMTANQIVAYNLKRIRELAGFSQEEAGKKLAPLVGLRSQAAWSERERSYKPGSKRWAQFDANELVAFSHVFGVPVSEFLRPPFGVEQIACDKSPDELVPVDALRLEGGSR